MTGFVRRFRDLPCEEIRLAGGKGGTLARLYQLGHPVPDGFIVLPGSFAGQSLKPEAWEEVRLHLRAMREDVEHASFAVRSSALAEDSSVASFAGGFETVLNACSDEDVRAAIQTVRRSGGAERVRAYSRAQGLDERHEIAVIVQRMVESEIAGVLFTVDPVAGGTDRMTGNYVHGSGEQLVSGHANPLVFSLTRPSCDYQGPDELVPWSGRLFDLGMRLENELAGPQDIEWAIARGGLYLLQSRPVTTLGRPAVVAGGTACPAEDNCLWSNANAGEANPDVTTPSTWSLWEALHCKTLPFKMPCDYSFVANIAGRFYFNFSLVFSMYGLSMKREEALRRTEEVLGRVPEGVDVPTVPLSRLSFVPTIPANIAWEWNSRRLAAKSPELVRGAPGWCDTVRRKIKDVQEKQELARLWRHEMEPYVYYAFWTLRAVMKLFTEQAAATGSRLTNLAGGAGANTLMTGFARAPEGLASLGPLAGLFRVARGEMAREEYLAQYGHRGPHEAELLVPRPYEDPGWLDRRLAELDEARVMDVEGLLAKQQDKARAAWERLRRQHPREAEPLQKRVDAVSEAARRREAVRSEVARIAGAVRGFVLRTGELTGLGDGAFFLTLDEMSGVLSGRDDGLASIPERRQVYARYSALPSYPTLIRGKFDPERWAAGPDRRSDYYDSRAVAPLVPESDVLKGFPGAAGRVEGLVRRLDSSEEGGRLAPGEILVTRTTNVGWTLLFPKARAIITDVGAPLSHAAIVARELGIPAVVGCGDATMRLKTGDRVLVDGERGTVTVLRRMGS